MFYKKNICCLRFYDHIAVVISLNIEVDYQKKYKILLINLILFDNNLKKVYIYEIIFFNEIQEINKKNSSHSKS